MADTLEFSDVAFPKDRFSQELRDELKGTAPSLIKDEGDIIFIRHLYIERRMMPLDIYLQQASPNEARAVLGDWADAITQLMTVNIFPGDLLFKSFGVTCQGKVVFYDYDEISYLSDCNFRKIPEARYPEDELSETPWYSIGPNDIFPEEFVTVLTGENYLRDILRTDSAHIFDYQYWEQRQSDIEIGVTPNICPYPEEIRFLQMDTAELPMAINE